MSKTLKSFVRETDDKPYVLAVEIPGDGEEGPRTENIRLRNPRRLKGRKFVEFNKRGGDLEFVWKSLAGDKYDELMDAFDRDDVDGDAQQEIIGDCLKHYGVDQGEAPAS